MSAAPLALSVVVPVFRGEPFLTSLVEELQLLEGELVARRAPIRLAEALFVDDRAVDRSPALLDELADRFRWIEVVHLRENVGQHRATAAGLARCRGDWVATLDEDGQHRPLEILRMLRRAVELDADLVFAAPLGRVHDSLYRDLTSRLAKRLAGLVAGDARVRSFNSFRLLRGGLAREAGKLHEAGQYLDVVLLALTRRSATLALRLEDPRSAASQPSGYSFVALLAHARRLLRGLRASPGPTFAAAAERLERTTDRTRDAPLRDYFAAAALER